MNKRFTTDAIVGIVNVAYHLEPWTVVIQLIGDNETMASTTAHRQRQLLGEIPKNILTKHVKPANESGAKPKEIEIMVPDKNLDPRSIVLRFQILYDSLNLLEEAFKRHLSASRNQQNPVAEKIFDTYQQQIIHIDDLLQLRRKHTEVFDQLLELFGDDKKEFDVLAKELRMISVLRFADLVIEEAEKF